MIFWRNNCSGIPCNILPPIRLDQDLFHYNATIKQMKQEFLKDIQSCDEDEQEFVKMGEWRLGYRGVRTCIIITYIIYALKHACIGMLLCMCACVYICMYYVGVCVCL